VLAPVAAGPWLNFFAPFALKPFASFAQFAVKSFSAFQFVRLPSSVLRPLSSIFLPSFQSVAALCLPIVRLFESQARSSIREEDVFQSQARPFLSEVNDLPGRYTELLIRFFSVEFMEISCSLA
jgi:hypothetical protein